MERYIEDREAQSTAQRGGEGVVIEIDEETLEFKYPPEEQSNLWQIKQQLYAQMLGWA